MVWLIALTALVRNVVAGGVQGATALLAASGGSWLFGAVLANRTHLLSRCILPCLPQVEGGAVSRFSAL